MVTRWTSKRANRGAHTAAQGSESLYQGDNRGVQGGILADAHIAKSTIAGQRRIWT
jgi:hypothetical protein